MRPLARFHPDRLVVVTPVEQVAVAGLLQQIGRQRRLRDPGPEPAARALPGMFFECRGGFRDQRALFVFGESALALGIAAAVADDLGAGKCGDRLRRVLDTSAS